MTINNCCGIVYSAQTFILSKSSYEFMVTAIFSCCCVFIALEGKAELVDSDDIGFTVSNSVVIQNGLERVYGDFKKIENWWSPNHTFSGIAKNLKLDVRPGGCFCEYFDISHGVEHLRVIHVRENELIRFSGALGPLQGMGAIGTLTIRFTKTKNGTSLSFDYIVIGRKLIPIAEAVDRVLFEQLLRLKKFSENGDPDFQE